METRDWNRIRELFDRALQCGPEERLDFLRRMSSDDAWLAAEVESLPAVSQPSGREVLPAAHKTAAVRQLARIDHRFGNEGDFGRPERFSESFAIDPVQVE